MLLPVATLSQLRAIMDKHQANRPGNYDISDLTKWSLAKEEIQGYIDLRERDSGRPAPIFAPPRIIAKVEKLTQAQHQSWVNQHLQDLVETMSRSYTLFNSAKRRNLDRCATLRWQIKDYCLRHSVECPDLPGSKLESAS